MNIVNILALLWPRFLHEIDIHNTDWVDKKNFGFNASQNQRHVKELGTLPPPPSPS